MVVFVVLLAIALFGVVNGNEEDWKIIDSICPEQTCTQAGGLCVIAADCPDGSLAEQGLCPMQQKKGVECCYGLSVKETRCEKHGGICRPLSEYCNPRIVFSNATNCPEDHRCCILVV